MKVTMYKCPWTASLFKMSERDEYIEHLRTVRKKNSENRRMSRVRKEFDEWLYQEKLKIVDVNQIESWIFENQEKLIEGMVSINNTTNLESFYLGDRIKELKITRLRHSSRVSNTHSCPKSGITNFRCLPDKPMGYPGWRGRIDGSLLRDKKNNSHYPITVLLNHIGLCTGSGGGGNINWGFELKIFADDWPGLIPSLYGQLWEEQEDACLKQILLEERMIINRLSRGRY